MDHGLWTNQNMENGLTAIETVGILGAGTMGQGIAQVCAQAGFRTVLYDNNQQVLAKALARTQENLAAAVEKGKLTEEQRQATLRLLHGSSDILDISADLIIEAVVERLEVKQGIFKDLAAVNHPGCILATNTSSLSITRMAKGILNPGRIVGLHFFNPAPVMKLVEVILGRETTAETAALVTEFTRRLGKTPVQAQDAPGFIVNRVARHYYLEALQLLEEQVADAATIDQLMEASGFKMGPFRLMDLIGHDVNFGVTTSLFEAFHYAPRFRPSRIQEQKVAAGHLGCKSGKGFYDYT
jgi:3-hydroxybutyryl-CoA dehydrogenase